MKRLFIPMAAVLLLLGACQAPGPKNQLFDSGPEVDNIAKNIKSYVDGDWAAFRAAYADTAKSYHNNGTMTLDSLVQFHKMARNNYDKVEIITYATEYVKFEKQGDFTHFWGLWRGTVKGTGKVVETNVHIACRMVNGKIGTEYVYYDPTPIVAALTEAREAAMASQPKK